jgi:phosphoribosylamine---glycine ligase
MSNRVLVIGGGAREHALCHALSQDSKVGSVVAAPGNPGIGEIAELRPVDVSDPLAIADLAGKVKPDLTVIGPEVPLVAGAADEIRARGLTAFGPSAAAAQIEGSKAFAKSVMVSAGVPTAAARAHTVVEAALADLDEFGPPYVVKADGLAAGKGVTVTEDREVAIAAVRACLQKQGDQLVLEEYLDGPEVSLFAVVAEDGSIVPLVPAQDFKRVGNEDTGPNTGGMGAYAPLPWAPKDLIEQVHATVLAPTVAELARRGTPFTGLLYAGLALTGRGIRVIEFNARFGDPETQVVLAKLTSPLTELLAGRPASWSPQAAVTVVVAAPGYPNAPVLGGEITGLEAANSVAGVTVLHAGTRREADGRLVSSGGRVLSVTGVGADLAAARESVYEAVAHIKLDGAHHRTDIADPLRLARFAAG